MKYILMMNTMRAGAGVPNWPKKDLQAHIARFPRDGAVLTTGANLTHVTPGRCVVLGPQDIAPHVLAHELGHILGFKDMYFRGYRDLGALQMWERRTR